MTQKGVGYLTALCLVNTIGEMRPLFKTDQTSSGIFGNRAVGTGKCREIEKQRNQSGGQFISEISARTIGKYRGAI